MTRLLTLMAPFRWWIIAGVLLSFATTGASVGLMAVSAYLISKAALVTDTADLNVIITGVRFFAISRAALRYAERYVTHLATFRILTRLRVWFYRAVEPLAPARLMQYRSGDLLTRIVADIETLENFYLRVVIPPLAAVLVTVLACLILGSFDVWLAVALLVFIVLTGVVLPLVTRWLSRQPASEMIATRAEMNASLVDEVQGIADLLAYGQEDAYQARALSLSRQLNRVQERLAVIRGMGNGLAALFTSLAALTVLLLAIPLVTGGQIEGVYLALLPLTAIASFEAVQPLAQAMQMLESSKAAARRIFELIDAEPAVIDPVLPLSPPTQGIGIEVSNLHFRYAPDQAPALDGVSFAVPPGGRVAIVGPNGSGKSTVVNLLLRFWDYDQGSIRIDGQEVPTVPSRRRARADRCRSAAHAPVQRHGRRQPVPGQPRGESRRADSGLPAGPTPRVHPGSAPGLRHPDRRKRPVVERRRAPTLGHRPGHPQERPDPDPGRGHLAVGRADRAAADGVAGAVHGRSNDVDHLAPPGRFRAGRSSDCARRWPHCGARICPPIPK